jgi:imidazole glycerol phosphate synthase glutamine amidotransferase subunit
MKQVVGVVDYGVAGNTHSIIKAIEHVGGKVELVSKAEQVLSVDKLVIPGVGSFPDAMSGLISNGISDALITAITVNKIPTLGICLGMQILAKIGYERGKCAGLSLIDAEVRKVKCKGVLPHMGFHPIYIKRKSALLDGVALNEQFYFMHSYEVSNYTDILSLSSYEGHTFVSAIEKDNLYGVQFHPEKSREAGLKVFHNFINVI